MARGDLAAVQTHSSDFESRGDTTSNGPSKNDETIADGNYHKRVGNEHTRLLMAYFLPLHPSPQRKEARESKTLGSAYAFSPLSFPKHPLLSLQVHSWFLNSHQVSGEGEILFLVLFVGEEIDAICLPLFYPPSCLDLTEGRHEGVHPVVSHVLWTTQSLHRDTIQRLLPFTGNIGSNLSALPKSQSLSVFKELPKRKFQEKTTKSSISWLNFQMAIDMEDRKSAERETGSRELFPTSFATMVLPHHICM